MAHRSRRQALLAALLALAACIRETPAPPPPVAPGPIEPVPPGAPMHRVTFGALDSEARDADPELSADAATLFFATTSQGDSYDIYRKAPDGTTMTRTVASAGHDRFPKLHPNGRSLAFSSDVSGEWAIYVFPDYRTPPDDWSKFRVSPERLSALHASWSPDGMSIAYAGSADPESGKWSLYVFDIDRAETHALGLEGLFPEFAPAGERRLLFQRMRERGNWLSGLWIARLKNFEVAEVTRLFDDADTAAINPAWSPDARHIVFAMTTREAPAAAVPSTARDLAIVTPDGQRMLQVTKDIEPDWMPTWGSDGHLYFVTTREKQQAVWRLSVEPWLRP